MNQNHVGPGFETYDFDQNMMQPTHRAEPCPICGDTVNHQIEINVPEYRSLNDIPDSTDTLEHIRHSDVTPDWTRDAAVTYVDIPSDQFLHLMGPLACQHQPSIKPETRIAGYMHNVYLDSKRLDPQRSLEIANMSPSGFSWGYGGSGPSQLALALVLEAGASDREAQRFYSSFMQDTIQHMPDQQKFILTGDTVLDWLKATRQFFRDNQQQSTAQPSQ